METKHRMKTYIGTTYVPLYSNATSLEAYSQIIQVLLTIMDANESCMPRLKALEEENHLAWLSSLSRSLAISASR